jgi:hypothetical protein
MRNAPTEKSPDGLAAPGKGPPERLLQEVAAPTTGMAVAATAVLGAAIVFGVLEAMLGAGAALVVYRTLKKGRR